MYTNESKEAYMQKLDAQIKEVDARIDMLNAKLQQMDANRKMAYQDEYDKLFTEKEMLKNQMVMMRETEESTWEKAKNEFDDKWNKFKGKVEDLYNKV